MKIRRRAHPIDPRKSQSRGVSGSKRLPTGGRMSRHGTPLYNHKGDRIEPKPAPVAE